MKKIAALEKNEREVLFSRTAEKMSLHPSIVEKDFWVCFMLDHLFHDCKFRDAFVFKGGTSLSKSYHVIERFSEDIDLIFDWRKLTDNTDPWEDRSKTKQDKYNKTINENASIFYRDELIPALNEELSVKLGNNDWVEVDKNDSMVIDFKYPKDFSLDYLKIIEKNIM